MALSDGEGFNFRSTLAYVTDPSDTQFCEENFTYPKTAGGVTFGWTVRTTNDRNRSTGVDARLAGIVYTSNNGSSQRTFRVDLDNATDHDIRLALGDANYSRDDIYCQLKDDSTTIATIDKNGSTLSSGHWYDATGVDRTSSSDWVSNNAAVSHTFSSTILNVIIGQPSSYSDITPISHLNVLETGGGASGVTVDLTGASATASARALSITASAILDLIGASATAAARGVASSGGAAVTLTGASAASAVGTITTIGNAIVPLTGATATGQAGAPDIAAHAVVPLTGVSATGQAGTLSLIGGATVTLTGVSATGQAGTVTIDVSGAGSVDVTLTGVSATAAIGDLDIVTGAITALDGAQATGQVGDIGIAAGALFALDGVSVTGQVGSVTATGGASVTLAGVDSSAVVGVIDITTAAIVEITGVLTTGQVGTLTVSAGASIQLPGYRVYTIEHQDRTLLVVEDDRTYPIQH